jgi:hypothetical protein
LEKRSIHPSAIIWTNKLERRDEMRWQEVQKRFPNEWGVLEVIKEYSDDGYRYIEDVVVVDTTVLFTNSSPLKRLLVTV